LYLAFAAVHEGALHAGTSALRKRLCCVAHFPRLVETQDGTLKTGEDASGPELTVCCARRVALALSVDAVAHSREGSGLLAVKA
jgi:hypothetical protein